MLHLLLDSAIPRTCIMFKKSEKIYLLFGEITFIFVAQCSIYINQKRHADCYLTYIFRRLSDDSP